MKNIFITILVIGLTTLVGQAQVNCNTSKAGNKVGSVGSTTLDHIAPTPTKDPLPFGPVDNKERMVWWVHGLGGNDAAWQRAIAATEDNIVSGYPARKSINFAVDYANNMSNIGASAANVKTDMQLASSAAGLTPTERKNAFVIAHSMGGLVSRRLDYLFDRPENEGEREFGGIVTFGTPHQGAEIINNAVPDANGNAPVLDFFSSSCVDLATGPTKEELYTAAGQSLFLRLVLRGVNIDTIVDGFCSTIEPVVPQLFEGFNQQITQDFKVGAAFIDTLNMDTTSIQKLAFWGEEDDETMFWRTMHYLMNNPNDDDYFDAVHDSIAVNWAMENALKYQAKYLGWKKMWGYYQYVVYSPCLAPAWNCDPCGFYGLPSSCQTVTKPEAKEIYEAYLTGYDWWNTANDQYRAIIGAVYYDTVQVQQCWCAPCVEWYPNGNCKKLLPSFYSHTGSFCDDEYEMDRLILECGLQPGFELELAYKKADGVVLAESASKFPNGDGTFAKAEAMPKSSHQQMRNDDNTKEKLLKVFDGVLVDWFYTPYK